MKLYLFVTFREYYKLVHRVYEQGKANAAP